MKSWKNFILYLLFFPILLAGCLLQNFPMPNQLTKHIIGEVSGQRIIYRNILWPTKIRIAINEEKKHLITGNTNICINQEEKNKLIEILSNSIKKINASVKSNSETVFMGKISQGEDRGIKTYFVPGNKGKENAILLVLQKNIVKRTLVYMEQDQIERLIYYLGIGG